MKYGIKAELDNRNFSMSIGVKKEEGESDFFEDLNPNSPAKIAKDEDDVVDLED